MQYVIMIGMVFVSVCFEIILSRMVLYGMYVSITSSWDCLCLVWFDNPRVWD